VKILHVIDSAGLYGAEMVLLALAEAQQQMGWHPVIASIGEPGIPTKAVEIEGRRRQILVVPFRMRPGPNPAGVRDILRYARRHAVDLLHLHGYKGDILFGFIPRRRLRMPKVATLHGWTHTGRINRLWAYEMLDTLSLRCMDAVVLVTERMRRHPRLRGLRPSRVHVVPNGVPDHLPFPAGSAEDGGIAEFCSCGPVLGAIGRLSPEKGHTHLLDAFRMVAPDFPTLRLLLIGDGPLRENLQRRTLAFGLADRVLFAGYRDQAWAYLPHMTLFVLPSLTEGLPITLLEAMRAGAAIVATEVGGVPAALGECAAGVLVPPGDPALLARGIHSLLENPARARELGAAAREAFVRRFSSRRMAEGYANIYRSLGVPCRA
jgi:glycosyltransferase involved in cell wall biosynthesis